MTEGYVKTQTYIITYVVDVNTSHQTPYKRAPTPQALAKRAYCHHHHHLTSPVSPVNADSPWWQDYQDAAWTQTACAHMGEERAHPRRRTAGLGISMRGHQTSRLVYAEASMVHCVLHGLTPYKWARVTSARYVEGLVFFAV
jgi:hypothetical protein